MRLRPSLLCVLPLLLLSLGCDEKLADLAGPTPDLVPTFSSIQSLIFAAPDASGRPACTNCHVRGGQASGTGLFLGESGTYGSLVGRPSRTKAGEVLVIPGDPDSSYLVRKLEGGPNISGVRMPFSGPYLSTGQLRIIRRWIQEGAANN
ncbi:MAG: hypothetical protein AB7O28_11615 [Vicinamibacterales bacterium]